MNLKRLWNKFCKVLFFNSLISYFYFSLKFFFMKTANKKTKNLATPGKPMSQDEFVSLIKEAEEGAFLTEKEFDKKFEEWRLQRKK